MATQGTLFERAKSHIHLAYAPYSRFQVACSIQTSNGDIFSGVNVENASFPMCQCAEASAIGTMITTCGESEITHVLVMADAKDILTPCGGCLQRLSEFCTPETTVWCADTQTILKEYRFAELFPAQFSGEHFR